MKKFKYHNPLSGANTSKASQLKKIQKLDLNNLPYREQVPISDLYLRWYGKWVHKGKSCMLCQTMLLTDDIVDKHRYVCSVLNTKEEEKQPHGLKGTGKYIKTPDGVYTMDQAVKRYKVQEEAIRYRIKKWEGWSYANTQD